MLEVSCNYQNIFKLVEVSMCCYQSHMHVHMRMYKMKNVLHRVRSCNTYAQSAVASTYM